MPLPEKFWIEQFKKAGLLAPERDGIIKEAAQAAGSTALQVGRGIGSTIEEVTGEPAIRQYFQEREAAKPHWRPDPNYSPSSLHPADVARTVSTGVTQSALSLGAGIVGGAVGGAPGALAATTAGVFAHTYGDRVKEYREAMPDADDGVIKGWAFLSALGESLIETVAGPEQMVAGMFKGVARQALSQTTKQLIKTIGKEAAKSALAEGSEEVCQMYWDNLVRLMAGQNVELQPFEEVRDTFMAGALPGAFMGGVGSVIQQSGGVIDPRQHLDPALQVVQGLSEQLKVPIRYMTDAEIQQHTQTDAEGNPVTTDGFYDDKKGEILINPNSEKAVEYIFGHELKHFLNDRHPDLVEVFDAMAQQNLTEQGQQELADTEALYGQLGDARTEFNAEWFARLAMEPDALREAAIIAENQKVGFGEKLINAITEFLKMVMDTVRKIGTPEMEAVFNNAKEVRAEAIKLLSDFNRRQHSQLVPVEQTPVKSERKLLPMGKPLVEQPPEERTRQKKLLEESQARSELEQLLKERQERRKVREDFLKHQEAMRKIDRHLKRFGKFADEAMSNEAFRRANAEELNRIEDAIRKGNPQLVREGLDRLSKRVRNWNKKNRRTSAGSDESQLEVENQAKSGNKAETKAEKLFFSKKLVFIQPEQDRQTEKPAPPVSEAKKRKSSIVPEKKLPFVVPEPKEESAPPSVDGIERVNTSEIHVDPKRFQFKSGTNPVTGVDESNKVGGEWDPKSAGLLYIWEDKTGKKFVVNGHHRLQLAKELGVPALNAIVEREVDGVTEAEARRQGVLTNIRDGQGRVEDYATFVREDKRMDVAAAHREGIMSRSPGRQGFMIGRYAGEELYAAFKAGDITGAKAAAIAESGKNDPAVQIAGMKKAKDMSAEQLREFLKILQLQQRQQKIEQLDLFGFDDSAIKMSEDISRLAIKKLRAIRERILTVRRAVAKPDVAQQGDVKVGKDAQKLLDEALQEQARWEHYETDRELYQQLMEEAGYGKKEEAPAKPEPVKSEPSKPLNPDNPLGLDGFDDMFTLFSESEKDTQKADQATARAEARAAEISKFNAIAKTPELDFEGAQQQQQQGQKPARPEQKQEPAQQTPEQKPEQKQQQEAESMQESQQKPETPPPPKGFVWTSSEAAQKLAEHKESQESKQPQAQARQESEFTLEPYPQTGEQKWVVKKKSGFANRQQFDLLHNQAKTLQGIYNKFAQGFLFDSEEDAKRFMERQSRGNVLYSLSRESKKFSLSRQHQQVNPILKDGKIRDEYRSWLENGRYTPQQVGEWHDKALRWIARQGGVLKAANEFADGTAPAGKIGAMAARLIMNSQEFAGFDEVLRKAVADQYIFQGTEWGREGVARRLASLNLDTIEKAQVFFDRLAAKMEKADREKMRKDVHDRTGVDIFNLPPDIVNDPAKLDEVLRAALASSATMQSKVREYWINAILSGPQTHAANMVGNFANMMYELGPKRLAEAMINLAARRKAGATVGEFKAMVSAFDWRSAWQRAKAAFDQEVLSPNGKVENTGVAIKGKHGRIIRLPGRLLKAADEFAKAIIAPVEAAAYAYREAMSKGLSESDAKDYIQRQLANKDSEANQFGATRAIELTFQEDPGAAVQHLIALREKGGIIGTFLQYFLPFIKTPTNLLRQGVRKSPLGVANLAGETFKLLRGKRQLDSDYISLVAEQLLAWGAVAMFLGMGDDDDDRPILTGTGAGMSLNERRFKGGIVPSYSIRIGDKYYNYRRLEPLSTGLALIADGMAAYRDAKHGKAATAAIKDMMYGATMLITEKSYLNSLDQIHQFITDPERGIEQWGTSFLASWIPNVTRQTVNTMDSNLRDYRSRARGNDWWKEQFFHTAGKAGLVRVAPMVDYFGREVKKYDAENSSPGADLWRLVSPIAVKPSPDMDKADLLLWNYNHANPDTAYWPGLPSYTFQRNRERFYFSGEDYADFAAESGKLAHKQINNAIRRGLLNVSKPTNKDIDLIKRIFTRARRETRDKFFAKKRYDRASFE